MITDSTQTKQSWHAASDWPWIVLLLVIVSLGWCSAYNRWTVTAWTTPVTYSGDAWAQLAGAKAFATGDIQPVLPKNPPSLGAPFEANWNDYPSIEEGIFAWIDLLARIFGVFAGMNLALLSASLLAAASFYFVCRQLSCPPVLSFAGAALFGLSRFAFTRSLDHLTLTFYWHVPLGILVLWYCVSDRSIHKDRRTVALCLLVAILHGVQNVYYTGMFLQFLAGASLYQAIRRRPWPQIVFPVALAAVVLSTFALMNVDTLYHRWVNGPNPQAIVRNYAGLELYALKPVELFVPIVHRVSSLGNWGLNHYAKQAYVVGEIGSPYLGIFGIIGFFLLVWRTARSLATQKLSEVPFHIWGLLWVLAYSIIGGINGLIGVFGLVLFRSTNRYSIVILAFVLLFLVQELTRLTNKWRRLAVAALAAAIVTVGVWDQVPGTQTSAQISPIRDLVQHDAKMVRGLEAKLPRGAMVFQMPVMEFPEVPPTRGVADYEHFRPYLHSKRLRFSYGSDKGRSRERWQTEAQQFGITHLAGLLEKYGFSAILINRKGYEDTGSSLLQELQTAGKTNVAFESPEFICVTLTPAARPVLPPDFDDHWSGLEGSATHDWRWSSGDSTVVLDNPETKPRLVRLSFRLEAMNERRLDISLNAQKLFGDRLSQGQDLPQVEVTISLAPGKNRLRFRTDRPGVVSGTGDPRKLAFAVHDFRLSD